jgi:nucleoside recognition membrane protein YjiH
MTALAGWTNFYVILGSSAGALIGLQFVVLTLVSNMPIGTDLTGGAEAGQAFATPTIVHFGTVLLLSALLSAPWHSIALPAALCGLVGLIGVVYVAMIVRRMQAQTVYRPEFEDWLFHVLLPLAAYATLAASEYASLSYAHGALFGVGAASLLLLFIGVHNAWDGVTYHVFNRKNEQNDSERRS